MRIAHVFPSQSWGGAEMYALKLAKWQAEAGADVGVWVAAGSRMLSEARALGLRLWTEPIPERSPWKGQRLATFMREEGIGTLHLHWSQGLWAFAKVKSYIDCRMLLHVHLWVQHGKRDPLHRLLYSKLDHLLVAGPRAEAAADKLLPIRTQKIAVLPYGVDLALSKAAVARREQFGFTNDDIIFGVFSRLDAQKGIREFVEACHDVLPSNPRAHAIIVGSPTANEASAVKYADELKAFANGGPAKKQIRFLPFQKDYLGLLKTCDVMVTPSYHESYSLAILDAMSCEVPVLGTLAGGTPDLVTGETGWLAEPRSAASLVERMREILQDPRQIQSKAKRALEFVQTHHDKSRIVAESLRLAQAPVMKTHASSNGLHPN